MWRTNQTQKPWIWSCLWSQFKKQYFSSNSNQLLSYWSAIFSLIIDSWETHKCFLKILELHRNLHEKRGCWMSLPSPSLIYSLNVGFISLCFLFSFLFFYFWRILGDTNSFCTIGWILQDSYFSWDRERKNNCLVKFCIFSQLV